MHEHPCAFGRRGLPPKRARWMGVGRRYPGALGHLDNYQVLTSSHIVDRALDWSVNMPPYLRLRFQDNPHRLAKAQLPPATGFKNKSEVALNLLDQAQ